MQLLTKPYVLENRKRIVSEIKEGKVFVYPTDTIYGLGCNTFNETSVKRIRAMKRRDDKPFSVIAPSIEWIFENFSVSGIAKAWISRLPGPYTLILHMKPEFRSKIAKSVTAIETLGVRIPNHWFYEIVRESGIPIVTTSANVSGRPNMTNFYDLDENIKNAVDFIVFEGEKKGNPSTIIDLTGEKEKIIR